MWLLYVDTFSSAPTSNCPPAPSSAISHYREYLEIVYENSTISPDTKWPPTPSTEFITLAVVEGQTQCRDKYIGKTLQGNIKQVLNNRKEISIEDIFNADKSKKKPPRLVLMEGAPGIGKSTLAWELCRKSMRQYSLVVLLRLREVKVQNISNMSQLFCQYESEDKKSLVEEVAKSQGRDMLFILDGFDELPKTLQEESFLLDLIRGRVLPASTVLVTSRPSATAELRTSCRPKHIEILGFTQESVEAYASSVFSSEPEKLTKFKAYISAAKNPAINSLMYVPLNAAIIVLIFSVCKSDALLPHTSTELYTQLCLTILNRYLKMNHPSVPVDKFDDLPDDLYQQFLHMSQVAFEGIKNEKVIFHTVPSNLVHFGFLDAVSALYGGGRVSYNFLHLTLQEFFAAYHISHLSSSGLEVFKQYGKEERWNVVWRFVAGLAKFKGYEGLIDSLFVKSNEDHKITLTLSFIQCLFEAQTMNHFSSLFRTSPTTALVVAVGSTALDSYALGYCIANFHTGVPWSVVISNYLTPFLCGLKTNAPSVGVIQQLHLLHSPDDVDVRELPLNDLIVLKIEHFSLTDADLISLSEHVPNMTHLKKLSICHLEERVQLHEDGLLKILQQLSHSNVTTLDIAGTGVCSLLKDSPHDYYSTIKALICPSSGRLEELCVGDTSIKALILPRFRRLEELHDDEDDDTLAGLVSGPSSLKTLKLNDINISPHVPYLMNNTCLTTLHIARRYYPYSEIAVDDDISHMATIVEHNKTLQHLEFAYCHVDDIYSLRTLVGALSSNNTLKSIRVRTSGSGHSDDEISSYIRTHHRDLTSDPRVTWCWGFSLY